MSTSCFLLVLFLLFECCYSTTVLQVTEMNGKMVGSKPLYVALAQRKEERRNRLQVSGNRGRQLFTAFFCLIKGVPFVGSDV